MGQTSAPRWVAIGEIEHVESVFRVDSRYDDGTPKNLTLLKGKATSESDCFCRLVPDLGEPERV